MKYLLTKEESEILFPGLKDMTKSMDEELVYYPIDQTGDKNLNWKGGITYDMESYTQTPEYKAKKRAYAEKYRKTPEGIRAIFKDSLFYEYISLN